MSLRGAGGRFVSEARAGFSARLREAFETVAPVVSCPLGFSTGFCSGFFSMDTAVLEWPSGGVGCAIRESGCDWFRLGSVPVVSEGRVRFPGGAGSDPVEVFRAVAESHEGAGRFTGNTVGEEGVLF